jgi:hypothetical protein
MKTFNKKVVFFDPFLPPIAQIWLGGIEPAHGWSADSSRAFWRKIRRFFQELKSLLWSENSDVVSKKQGIESIPGPEKNHFCKAMHSEIFVNQVDTLEPIHGSSDPMDGGILDAEVFGILQQPQWSLCAVVMQKQWRQSWGA